MYYPSDTYYFACSLSGTVVSGDEPIITVVDASTGTAVTDATSVLVQARAMTLIAGSNKVYVFPWRIATNQGRSSYVALVTYTVSGVYHHDEFLDKVQVGDARVTGVVALEATCAKDATVAKDLTVAKGSDVASVKLSNDAAITAIKAKTDLLPATPLGLEHLYQNNDVVPQAGSLAQMLQDILDAEVGSWIVDKTQSPARLTILRASDNSVMATFTMSNDVSSETRQRV